MPGLKPTALINAPLFVPTASLPVPSARHQLTRPGGREMHCAEERVIDARNEIAPHTSRITFSFFEKKKEAFTTFTAPRHSGLGLRSRILNRSAVGFNKKRGTSLRCWNRREIWLKRAIL